MVIRKSHRLPPLGMQEKKGSREGSVVVQEEDDQILNQPGGTGDRYSSLDPKGCYENDFQMMNLDHLEK